MAQYSGLPCVLEYYISTFPNFFFFPAAVQILVLVMLYSTIPRLYPVRLHGGCTLSLLLTTVARLIKMLSSNFGRRMLPLDGHKLC
jgi:hypothetical protein